MRARYRANAAAPDGARTRRAAAIGGLAALVLLGGYRLWHRADGGSVSAPGAVPGQLPACDSALAQRLLRQAVEDQATALTGPIRVQAITEMTDHAETVRRSIDALRPAQGTPPEQFAATVRGMRENAEAVRSYSARLYTSRGVRLYGYGLSWTSPARDQVYLEAVAAQ
ncbi:hypothetical protein [Methylobacterium sp. SD21]|uniref:hypothetical protein n=1 Tax=Methylobacterium litchii TaxID=3138810 RepID=UPI00313D2D77